MLVLSRGIGEVIHVGQDIEVRVLGVSGRHVRLGVEAPKALQISRSEPGKQSKELKDE